MRVDAQLHAAGGCHWVRLPGQHARRPQRLSAPRASLQTSVATARRPLSAVVAELHLLQEHLQELAELVKAQEQLSSSSSSSESEADAPPASLTMPVEPVASTLQVAPAANAESPVADVPSSAAPALAQSLRKVQVCTGKACRKKGSEAMLAALQVQAKSQPGVSVVACKCLDKCKAGPNVQLSEAAQIPHILSGVRPLQYADILGQLVPV